MNIDGTNDLACLKGIDEVRGAVAVYPLPHLRVVKDLVPDLTNFYAQQRSSPGSRPRPQRRRTSAGRTSRNATSSTAFTNAFCAPCSTACPCYWWNADRYLGSAALLQAYRWVSHRRDEAAGERLDGLEDPFRLYRCHTIMNCAKVARRA